MTVDYCFERYGMKPGETIRQEIDQIIGAIFKDYPGISFILAHGWTPYFNDGEPCEHDQYFASNLFDDCSALDEIQGEEKIEALLPKNFDFDAPMPKDIDTSKVKRLLEAITYLYKAGYNTNWNILHLRDSRKPNGVATVVFPYEPPY